MRRTSGWVGFTVIFGRRGTQRPNDEDSSQARALETLIKPYTKVILRTSTLPNEGSRVIVVGWEDLVKVSDTLGKPILRVHTSVLAAGGLFYVRDGLVDYVFEYGPKQNAPEMPPTFDVGSMRAGNATVSSLACPTPPPEPADKPSSRDRPVSVAPSSPPIALPGSRLYEVTEQAKVLLLQVRDAQFSDESGRQAMSCLEEAISFLHDGKAEPAERELDHVRGWLEFGAPDTTSTGTTLSGPLTEQGQVQQQGSTKDSPASGAIEPE